MSGSRRRYSREFKLEVVRRVQELGRTQAQIAEELGVSANTINRWMKEFGREKEEAFPGKGRQTIQAALPKMLAGLSSAGSQGKIEFDQAAGQPG